MKPEPTVEMVTPTMQIQCEAARPSFGPHSPTTTAPASGASATSR